MPLYLVSKNYLDEDWYQAYIRMDGWFGRTSYVKLGTPWPTEEAAWKFVDRYDSGRE